jgi:hypothetical protein
MLLKVYCEILVMFRAVQNFKISDLAMAKVEKVNIQVTYKKLLMLIVILNLYFKRFLAKLDAESYYPGPNVRKLFTPVIYKC